MRISLENLRRSQNATAQKNSTENISFKKNTQELPVAKKLERQPAKDSFKKSFFGCTDNDAVMTVIE